MIWPQQFPAKAHSCNVNVVNVYTYHYLHDDGVVTIDIVVVNDDDDNDDDDGNSDKY